MTEKRKSCDLKFRQSVIKYAEENSNREAGRKFSIDESMVRRWRKKFSNYSIPDFNSPFRKVNAASVQGRFFIIF